MVDHKGVCHQALIHFGHVNQLEKCKEELHELLYELNQFDPNKERLVDEVADVIIMMIQMTLLLGEEEVNDRIEFKLKRLQDRMKERQ